MNLFIMYVSWQNYAAGELARDEVSEAISEAKLKRLEAEHMVTHWSSAKDKVTVARAEMAVDPVVEAARQEFLYCYAKRKLTQVMFSNCERSAAVLSRELSRRVGREGVERRSMRWSS